MKVKHWILIALVAVVLGAKATPQAICWYLEPSEIPEMVEAFTSTYKYSPTITQFDANGETFTIDNPETAAQFTKKQIANFALEVRNAYKEKKAAEEASAAVKAQLLNGDAIGI